MLRQVDVTTCMSFLNMCGMAGDAANAEEAWQWCCQIPEEPSVKTYNIMIDVLEKCGECDKAVQLFDRMRGQGIEGDMKTYGAMVDVYAAKGDWNKQKTALKVCCLKQSHCLMTNIVSTLSLS